MDVDGAFNGTHYPGSGVVNTPAFYPPRSQGSATSPMSQIGEYFIHRSRIRLLTHRSVTQPYPQVPQLPNRQSVTSPASNGGHRTSSQYGGSASGSGAPGFFKSTYTLIPVFSAIYHFESVRRIYASTRPSFIDKTTKPRLRRGPYIFPLRHGPPNFIHH